jgi:lambda repressor-like predicted transcriptional regulator
MTEQAQYQTKGFMTRWREWIGLPPATESVTVSSHDPMSVGKVTMYMPMRQSAAALSGNLKRLMAERGWDVRRLSREAEVSVSTIRGILNGIYPTSVADPLLSTCLKLALALGVGIEELVRE